MMQDETEFTRHFPYRLVPTNLPGAYATPAPPDDFDPRTASAVSLIKNGVPWRRPQPGDHPALTAAWERLLSRRWLSKDRIVPVLVPVPGKSHELKHPVRKEENGIYSSPFWGGCVLVGQPSNWSAAQGFWTIPTVSQPSEPQGTGGGWDSSSWVGMDGYSVSIDVVQAGVEQSVNSAGEASYVAWVEWWVPPPTNLPEGTPVDANGYPEAWVNPKNGKYQYIYQSNIPNFPVTAGQTVTCSILYNGNHTAAQISFANETTGQQFQVNFNPPPGANFNGTTAEWIMEAPNFGWPKSSLPKFTPLNFTDAFATTAGCASAGIPTNGDILNLTANGKQITATSVTSTSVTIDFIG